MRGSSGVRSAPSGFSMRIIWSRTHLATSHKSAKHETNTSKHARPEDSCGLIFSGGR